MLPVCMPDCEVADLARMKTQLRSRNSRVSPGTLVDASEFGIFIIQNFLGGTPFVRDVVQCCHPAKKLITGYSCTLEPPLCYIGPASTSA